MKSALDVEDEPLFQSYMAKTSAVLPATIAIILSMMNAGCDDVRGELAKNRATPEPHDVIRSAELIEQLGTDRSYERQTLLANPEPDGRIFAGWQTRRQATLDHRLRINQIPASTNPGSVEQTLRWEVEARKIERSVPEITEYWTTTGLGDAMGIVREPECKLTFRREKTWYDAERHAWAVGQRTQPIDFAPRIAAYKASCSTELNALQAAVDTAEDTAEARRLAQGRREEVCEGIWKESKEAASEALVAETWEGVPDHASRSVERYRAALKKRDECIEGAKLEP